jgi:hypothetical protein
MGDSSTEEDNKMLLVNGFSGSFAKSRKININFVMSVRPHGTTRLPMDAYSRNFVFEDFSKISWQNSSSSKIRQEQRVLYMGTFVHLQYFAEIFLKWEVICVQQTIYENRDVYTKRWKNVLEPDRAKMKTQRGREKIRFACQITKHRLQPHTYILFNIEC